MKKMLVGVIGYGYWGPNIVRLLNESEKTEIRYCSDLLDSSLKHIKQRYPNIKVTKDYKNILNDNKVKAVFIVTPTKTHFQIAKDCLMAKKHVFVEKPLTYEVKHSEELIRIAKKFNRV